MSKVMIADTISVVKGVAGIGAVQVMSEVPVSEITGLVCQVAMALATIWSILKDRKKTVQ